MKLSVFLNHWNRFTIHHNKLVILLFALLTAGSIFCCLTLLSISTDTRDMLSEDLQWRKLDIEYETTFPHVVDTLAIVISAPTPDEAIDTAITMQHTLESSPDLFQSVFYFKNLDFIRQSSLLYLSVDELENLATRLATYQPFLSDLLQNQTLQGFTDLLVKALENSDEQQLQDLKPLLEEYISAFEHKLVDEPYNVSWQQLIQNLNTQKDMYREVIVVQPKLDYSHALPAQKVFTQLNAIANEFKIANNDIQIEFTGPVALAHEELVSVSKANIIAIVSALVLVSMLLFTSLGSFQLVLLAIYSLITGLFITAGFASIVIGQINLISIAFAVLYIGLGIDFTIHYCMKYLEIAESNTNTEENLEKVLLFQWRPLGLCAITTAIGFFSFLNTNYHGIAELGIISGAGMFISFITTLSLIPALISFFGINHVNAGKNRFAFNFFNFCPEKHYKLIIVASVLLVTGSLIKIQDIYFDNNILNLQPQDNPSVISFRKLIQDENYSPLNAMLLVNDQENIETIVNKIEKLSSVKQVLWLDRLVPEQQDIKLALIDDMDLFIGETLAGNTPYSKPETIVNVNLSLLSATLEQYRNNSNTPDVDRWHKKILSIQQSLSHLDETTRSSLVKNVEHSVFKNLYGRISQLESGLLADTVNFENIPEILKKRWYQQGVYLLEILPEKDVSQNENLDEFIMQLQDYNKHVTGPTVINIEAGRSVIVAFKQAFTTAMIAIIIFLLITLERKLDMIFIILPLCIAALLTGATAAILGIPLNFANIIALPLIFAIGVDSAIHIVNQKTMANIQHQLINSSTAKAILVSGLTTILSIGNLALSPHVGTASMGSLLAIGISYALFCSLVITPALLTFRK